MFSVFKAWQRLRPSQLRELSWRARALRERRVAADEQAAWRAEALVCVQELEGMEALLPKVAQACAAALTLAALTLGCLAVSTREPVSAFVPATYSACLSVLAAIGLVSAWLSAQPLRQTMAVARQVAAPGLRR